MSCVDLDCSKKICIWNDGSGLCGTGMVISWWE